MCIIFHGVREMEEIEWIEKEIESLEAEESEIVREMAGLEPLEGCIEYKWVKNKIGRRYWYFYLRRKRGEHLISIYIGKKIPEELIKAKADREKLRMLKKKLREVRERLKGLYRLKIEKERTQ